MSQAAAEILRQGILGAFLVIAGFVIYFLYGSLEAQRKKHIENIEALHAKHLADTSALQQARLADYQAGQQLILDLTRTCVATISSGTSASTATKESIAELRATLKEHTEALLEALQRAQSPSSYQRR